jgi:hypothetical protein
MRSSRVVDDIKSTVDEIYSRVGDEIFPTWWWDLAEWLEHGCQCQSCHSLGFDPSILRHSGIWWAADDAVLNNVQRKRKIQKNSPFNIYICFSSKYLRNVRKWNLFGVGGASWRPAGGQQLHTGQPGHGGYQPGQPPLLFIKSTLFTFEVLVYWRMLLLYTGWKGRD